MNGAYMKLSTIMNTKKVTVQSRFKNALKHWRLEKLRREVELLSRPT